MSRQSGRVVLLFAKKVGVQSENGKTFVNNKKGNHQEKTPTVRPPFSKWLVILCWKPVYEILAFYLGTDTNHRPPIGDMQLS